MRTGVDLSVLSPRISVQGIPADIHSPLATRTVGSTENASSSLRKCPGRFNGRTIASEERSTGLRPKSAPGSIRTSYQEGARTLLTGGKFSDDFRSVFRELPRRGKWVKTLGKKTLPKPKQAPCRTFLCQPPRPEGRSLRFKCSIQTAIGRLTAALEAMLIAALKSA